jgi:hypothetical protein
MNWTAKFIITAILGVMGTIIAQAQTGGNYTITQSVIGAGGGTSTGGAGSVYTVESTFGQAIAGTTSSNMTFSVKGGFWAAPALAPTAAAVSISGRVVTPQELGLTNALITLTDSQGNWRTVRTGKLGSFRFTDVMAGETYILTITSRRYSYAPQVITVIEDMTELLFVPQ